MEKVKVKDKEYDLEDKDAALINVLLELNKQLNRLTNKLK